MSPRYICDIPLRPRDALRTSKGRLETANVKRYVSRWQFIQDTWLDISYFKKLDFSKKYIYIYIWWYQWHLKALIKNFYELNFVIEILLIGKSICQQALYKVCLYVCKCMCTCIHKDYWDTCNIIMHRYVMRWNPKMLERELT